MTVFLCQIPKTRQAALECEFDVSNRAMSLLADHNFGFAVNMLHSDLPLRVFGGPFSRFLTSDIILFTVNEKHCVGVLFD